MHVEVLLGRPGSVLLSRDLSQSTIGAEGFHFRVRDGIGCRPLAITTESAKKKTLHLKLFCRSIFTGTQRTCSPLRVMSDVKHSEERLCVIKPIERLVLLSFKCYHSSTCNLSTWWSSTALIGKSSFEIRVATNIYVL